MTTIRLWRLFPRSPRNGNYKGCSKCEYFVYKTIEMLRSCLGIPRDLWVGRKRREEPKADRYLLVSELRSPEQLSSRLRGWVVRRSWCNHPRRRSRSGWKRWEKRGLISRSRKQELQLPRHLRNTDMTVHVTFEWRTIRSLTTKKCLIWQVGAMLFIYCKPHIGLY